MEKITLTPIGTVHSSRKLNEDDDWDKKRCLYRFRLLSRELHPLVKTLILSLFLPLLAQANTASEYRLATGQGIAAPNVPLLTNMHRGYTAENPAGVMFQDGFSVSAGMAKNVDTDMEFQAGYGGKTFGGAVGMLTQGCSGCKAVTSADLGMAFQKTAAIGLRYQTTNNVPTYGAGAILNQGGNHRLGVVFEREMVQSPGYSISRYGGGYAYVTKATTFTLEASKQQSDDPNATTANKIMVVSGGFQKRVDPLLVSINYEMRSGDNSKPNDLMWMGAGFDSTSWNLSFYVNFHQEMMAVLAAYF